MPGFPSRTRQARRDPERPVERPGAYGSYPREISVAERLAEARPWGILDTPNCLAAITR